MSHHTKQDQLRDALRPLAEQFTAQVAATVMAFVQDSVRHEVEAVLQRAVLGVDTASLTPAAAPQAIIVVRDDGPAPVKAAPRPKGAPAKAAPVVCSRRGCTSSWYRPSGRDKKLCYQHFLESGGKPPPGKARK
jgi:hypothetical protein